MRIQIDRKTHEIDQIQNKLEALHVEKIEEKTKTTPTKLKEGGDEPNTTKCFFRSKIVTPGGTKRKGKDNSNYYFYERNPKLLLCFPLQ